MASSLYEFTTSKLRRSKVPSHRAFATPRLREFGTPDHHAFTTPRLREFQTPDPRNFFVPENIFTNFMNLNVSRVTGFPEFPNTKPHATTHTHRSAMRSMSPLAYTCSRAYANDFYHRDCPYGHYFNLIEVVCTSWVILIVWRSSRLDIYTCLVAGADSDKNNKKGHTYK
jgi:hypothetical protein